MKELPELIAGLSAADHNYAFFCLQTLEEESCNSARIYNFLDVFTAMLWSENSYLRTRGFRLIAANAKWDSANKIEAVQARCLACLRDVKPTAARQCLKALPAPAAAKPLWKSDIITALAGINISSYPPSMQPLLAKDVRDALDALGQ